MADPDVWKNHFNVTYATEAFPRSVTKSIFLAGPTPRSEDNKSWRPKALEILSRLGFDGAVFVPEPRDGKWAKDYTDQVEWEESGMQRADCIVFWIPRDMKGGMAGLTTNDEWGVWKDSGKVVLGTPPDADHIRYQRHYAKKQGVPIADSLEDTLKAALTQLEKGALRTAGECQVPLHIWNRQDFQEWYRAQKNAGNRLDNCRVDWSFRVPAVPFEGQTAKSPPQRVFLYALHVDVHIGAENRNKVNEIALFRPPVSSVVLYRHPENETHPQDRVLNTQIVLVKEFRSPVRNSECYVYELPGGSSRDPNEDPRSVAAHEVEEETGLKIDPGRFQARDTRQLGSTLSTHTARLFKVELTAEELEKVAMDESIHGVEEDTERTYVEVWTVGRMLSEDVVDWSTIGMVIANV